MYIVYIQTRTQDFVQDLMDGYCPYELHYEYPDGVPFNVIIILHNKSYKINNFHSFEGL